MPKITISAYAVRYHTIEYYDKFIVVHQHRTRRRIPNGYYFEDTGIHIYISGFYNYLFQSTKRTKLFVVNTETKEWEPFQTIIEEHTPEKKEPLKNNYIKELKK